LPRLVHLEAPAGRIKVESEVDERPGWKAAPSGAFSARRPPECASRKCSNPLISGICWHRASTRMWMRIKIGDLLVRAGGSPTAAQGRPGRASSNGADKLGNILVAWILTEESPGPRALEADRDARRSHRRSQQPALRGARYGRGVRALPIGLKDQADPGVAMSDPLNISATDHLVSLREERRSSRSWRGRAPSANAISRW